MTNPNSVRTLSDLAAALLVRAQLSQDVRDVFQAIEVADSAVRQDSSSEQSQFNLAMALEIAGLDVQAAAAWKRYAVLDPSSGWSAEARVHLSRLAAGSKVPLTKPLSLSDRDVREFTDAFPQEARIYAFDHLLGEWAEKAVSGDSAGARRCLELATVVGAASKAVKRDTSLVAAISAIRGAASTNLSLRLAQAHASFSAGQKLYKAADYADAAPMFRRAVDYSGESPALRQWATLFYAATLAYGGRPPEALRLMSQVFESTKAWSPSLAGRAKWMMGTTHMRMGLYERALNEFDEAFDFFTSCGEREYQGVTRVLAGDARFHLGDAANAYRDALKALSLLRPYHRTLWVHNLLAITAAAALSEGFSHAAFRLQTEGLNSAEALAQPLYVAEARIARARIAARLGWVSQSQADLAKGAVLVGQLPPGLARRWLTADLALSKSEIQVAGQRSPARSGLDSAVLLFTGLQNQLRLVPALLARANSSLDANDVGAATKDLIQAARTVAAERDSVRELLLHESIGLSSRDVFSRAATLLADAGDTSSALRLVQRAGAYRTESATNTAFNGEGRTGVPQAFVDYAVRSDTLFIWTLTGATKRLTRAALGGFQLEDSVVAVLQFLESPSGARSADSLLRHLHRKLISPIASLLPAQAEVALSGDPWVAATPFAALRADNGRYFVQDHAIRFARNFGATTSNRVGGGSGVLLVANPSFDSRSHPSLSDLPQALPEAQAIQQTYSHASMIQGRFAVKESVLRSLGGASIFHYAGHAVIDETRPMASYLALSPSAGNPTGELSASDIRLLKLENMRLVVLSACETARPRLGRSRGMNGLALAFLGAGARGVVGTLWKLDDRDASRLMVAFHRNLRAGPDAAVALRAAQLELLQDGNAKSQSPAHWGAFQYLTQ